MPINLALFTGVAGAIDRKLKQWDIVISDSVMQHDMDVRPIFEKYVIPAINNQKIFTNKLIINSVFNSLNKKLREEKLKKFSTLIKGLIATGDKFISEKQKIKELSKEIVGLLAVEIGGAAFAQVVPFKKA